MSLLWGETDFAMPGIDPGIIAAPGAALEPILPDVDEDEEQPTDIVEHRTLDDGRTIGIDRKGRWFDSAGRRLVPIRGERAFRQGENDGLVCPDCSSPIRWKCGSWGCPAAPRFRRFCGGLAIPARRRPRDKIKWSCGSCGHTWKTHKDDETPVECPKCEYRGVRFEKRVSR